jgi:5-formyltetrahydrofolate cyclo-ligase
MRAMKTPSPSEWPTGTPSGRNRPDEKAAIRAELRRQRPTAEQARTWSEDIVRHLRDHLSGERGRIAVFLPLADEPNIMPLLQELLAAGRPLAAPAVDAEDRWHWRILDSLDTLLPAASGTRQPDSAILDGRDLERILVPCRAFSSSGVRLGRGGGIYDRLLAGLPAVKTAVVFRSQLRSSLPVETHDVRLEEWIDESGRHVCRPE